MRLMLLIAALAAVSVALNTGHAHREHIRSVLKSWDPKRDITYMETAMPSLRNLTTAAKGFGGISRGCMEPGYTGETCQYPMCGSRNPYIRNLETETVPIDAYNLANCSQSMVILFDETMYETEIEIESQSPLNPTFILIGEDGQLVPPDDDFKTPSSYKATFFQVPSGQYMLSPRADLNTEFCTMLMTAKTSIRISGGFTSGYQSERNDYPQEFAYFDTPSTVTLHAHGIEFPAEIQAIGFTGSLNHISRYTDIGRRYNCSYAYIHEKYTCYRTQDTDFGSMYMQVEGVSADGYKFRRILPYSCVLPPVTPTTTPSTTPAPTPIDSCKNGGKLLHDENKQPYCYCFGYFTGKDCSEMLCSNGGFLSPTDKNRCECPEGFAGMHCENVICTDNSELSFDAQHPTLTFVIRTRTHTADVLKQVSDSVSDLLNKLSFNTEYLSSFIVVLFNNNKIISSKRYTSWADAQTDLSNAMDSATNDGGCDDSVFSSIADALSLYPDNKSPLYVITDATPNDSNEKETVFHMETYWRAPIYFIYLQPLAIDDCHPSLDNPGYLDFLDIAQRTSGDAFYLGDRKQFQNFLRKHMLNTVYRSQLTLTGDYTHCSKQNPYKSVAFDADTDMFVVVATGNNLSLVVTDPLANRITLDAEYSDGQNFIWSKNGVFSGQWFFTLISNHPNDACTFRVYRKKYNHIASVAYSPDNDIFWSFTTEVEFDGHLRQPVLDFSASPVFTITQYSEMFAMERVHATLQIYAMRDGEQVEVYGSSGIWRDGCSLQFFFEPFTCRVPNEILYFNIFARDRFDMTLQRAGTMYCTAIHPTPIPEHQCQNGGVMNPSNTTCFCTPEFTGKYCQTKVCLNGATLQGDICLCAPGYAGDHCELARCTEPGPPPEFLRYGVDMVFAVEITANSMPSIVYLQKNFQEILRDVHFQHRDWIRNFVLVGFNSTWGGEIAIAPAHNPTKVIDALNDLAKNIPTDKGCRVQLWRALDNALFNRRLPAGSYIEIFQTTPEDDTDAVWLELLYEKSRKMDIIMYGFLATDERNQPNGFVCNATVEDYYTLLGLVAGSTGNSYAMHASEISNAIRLIPLQYSNGDVQFNFNPDCRHEPMITYFPVDSYTQTIMLDVFGFGTTLEVFDGQGKKKDSIELFYDNFTGQSVYEVRKPCEDGWDGEGQYCFKFVLGDNSLPMPDAKKFCAAAGGFLADDLTEDKNSFLWNSASRTQFWIGLYNNGTDFVWDRRDHATPLNQDPTFWADNNPGDDSSKQCVFYNGQSNDQTKVWTVDSCSVTRPFLCQKHRYDENHEPNRITDDDLPAGMWYAKLKSSATSADKGMCSLDVRVQSSIQIVTGFSTKIGNDNPDIDPIQDSKENHLITYIFSDGNENREPMLTDAVLWDASNGTFYNGLKYEPRFGCQYKWASQDFPCPNGLNQNNEFGIMHIGEDEFGHTFQRVSYGHCSKQEIRCGHGVRQNGRCVCEDYWTGSLCTVPICVNGGQRNIDERSCTCPKGFEGPNCQYATCQPLIPQMFSNNRKSLVFVVEATKNNLDTINQVTTNLTKIVNGMMDTNPMWFSNYALVTFNANGIAFEKYDYDTIDDLVAELKKQAGAITDQGACALPLYSVLAKVAEHDDDLTVPDSEMFVITTAAANDESSYNELADNLFNLQAHVHFVYSTNPVCKDNMNAPTVKLTTWVGYGSGGNIVFTDKDHVSYLLTQYMPTLYGSSVLQDPTGVYNFDCSNNAPWYVPVDFNTSHIYVTTTSEFGTISVKNPQNAIVNADVIYNVEEQKIYRISVDRHGGIWQLSLTNPPGLCLAHVYASSDAAKVYTMFSLVNPVGKYHDPSGEHQDGRLTRPVPQVENVATFHLEGAPHHRGRLEYVEIFDVTNASNILRSELYRREACTYEYFSDPFVCDTDVLGIFVHGIDEFNQQFRRQEIVVCNGHNPSTKTTSNPPVTQPIASSSPTTPTTTSPKTMSPKTKSTPGPNPDTTTSPSHRTAQADVVFLVDASKAAQSSFNDFKRFIKNLMVNFNVGQAGARVALLDVAPNMDDKAPAIAFLNTITSQENLNDYLDKLDLYASFDDAGQILNEMLLETINPQFTNSGYRTEINNHVVIYITATTDFDKDPSATAKQILGSNQYGIITVGYGNNVDKSKLTAVAGGNDCSFTATDFVGLTKVVQTIQQKIFDASYTTNGKYC